MGSFEISLGFLTMVDIRRLRIICFWGIMSIVEIKGLNV
jgi:hypothetical protein